MKNISGSASTTFLFDVHRTGRAKFTVLSKFEKKIWEKFLPSYPPKCPESTPCFDEKGNMYFASHDGCFYSVNSENGDIRWIYKIGDRKTYGSPSITNDRVLIVSGDGVIFCFNTDGEVFWKKNIVLSREKNPVKRKMLNLISNFCEHLPSRGNKSHVRCWSSPLIIENKVYITCYRTGLHCFDVFSGDLIFSVDLGFPYFHSSGVLLTIYNEIIAVSQTGIIFMVDKDSGKIKNKKNLNFGWKYNSWGNPSTDPETGNIYLALSYSLSKSIVFCLDLNLDIIWKKHFPCAIRGSISIGYNDLLYFGGFNGIVYSIEKKCGKIAIQKTISKAKRALWTTPAIDENGNILITSKISNKEGKVFCLDEGLNEIWGFHTGKCLSVPVIDKSGRVYFGTWGGSMVCLSTGD